MPNRPLYIIFLLVTSMSACSLSEDLTTTTLDASIQNPTTELQKIAETPRPPPSTYLVELEIKPLATYSRAGESFSFSTRLTSRGSQSTFPVMLKHAVLSKTTNEIIAVKEETIGLETIASKRTDIGIAKTTKPGRYVMQTTAQYESGFSDSSFEFDIEPAVAVQPSSEPKVVVSTQGATQKNFTLVTITGFGYQPKELTIRKGSFVRWINKDTSSHTATGAGFDMNLRSGEWKEHQFNDTRIYSYTDTYSGIEPGKITVIEK